MKVKTQDLTGAALDWAVAKAVGEQWSHHSTDWSQCGQLIDEHKIKVAPIRYAPGKDQWVAGIHYFDESDNPQYLETTGISALNAACRAIVAAKLGDEVDVPEGLV